MSRNAVAQLDPHAVELGARRVVSAMALLLGPHGASQIVTASLSVSERVVRS